MIEKRSNRTENSTDLPADRRALGPLFRTRLDQVIARSGLSKTRFAERIGVDRSALSQLLSDRDGRLPRAETLAAISRAEGVSLDWLLGLSREDGLATEVAAEIELEERADAEDNTRLLEWRREALGAKTRYVPARLPDQMRLPQMAALERRTTPSAGVQARVETDRETLALSRGPQADVEACMPRQRIEALAMGAGLFSDAPQSLRLAQLRHMAELTRELYPRFRLFLFDGAQVFSAPYTVFGVRRAAIYLGDMYIVLNGQAQIDALSRHFDGLIRRADIDARDAADFVDEMRDRAERGT